MSLSAAKARSIVIIGGVELCVMIILIICGMAAMTKITSPANVTVGIWAIYFIIPGTLCLLAGYKETTNYFRMAIVANIIGMIVAALSITFGGSFWSLLNKSYCNTPDNTPDKYHENLHTLCLCIHESKTYRYGASCSDLKTVGNLNGVITVVNAFTLIACFAATVLCCICITTCYTRREQSMEVSAPVSAQPGPSFFNSPFINCNPPPYTALPNEGYHGASLQSGYFWVTPQQSYHAMPGSSRTMLQQQGFSGTIPRPQQGFTATILPPPPLISSGTILSPQHCFPATLPPPPTTQGSSRTIPQPQPSQVSSGTTPLPQGFSTTIPSPHQGPSGTTAPPSQGSSSTVLSPQQGFSGTIPKPQGSSTTISPRQGPSETTVPSHQDFSRTISPPAYSSVILQQSHSMTTPQQADPSTHTETYSGTPGSSGTIVPSQQDPSGTIPASGYSGAMPQQSHSTTALQQAELSTRAESYLGQSNLGMDMN